MVPLLSILRPPPTMQHCWLKPLSSCSATPTHCFKQTLFRRCLPHTPIPFAQSDEAQKKSCNRSTLNLAVQNGHMTKTDITHVTCIALLARLVTTTKPDTLVYSNVITYAAQINELLSVLISPKCIKVEIQQSAT